MCNIARTKEGLCDILCFNMARMFADLVLK